MDEDTYAKIVRELNSPEDISELAKKFRVSKSALFAILAQKEVRAARSAYPRLREKAEEIKKRWDGGETIYEISREFRLPPVLTAHVLLKSLMLPRPQVKKLIKNPSLAENVRLGKELAEAAKRDLFYSPLAHELQLNRGKIGEEIIKGWLLGKKVHFVEEKKNSSTKTPDFVLDEPFEVEGRGIRWIDSKASFGDKAEHKRYIAKQFSSYIELFGEGMVVYWFGFVDGVEAVEPRILIKDAEYFSDFEGKIKKLRATTPLHHI